MLLLLAAAAAHAGPDFDAERVRWTTLEFSASKFLMSAEAAVETRVVPAASITDKLVTTPIGQPVSPGPEVIEMIYRASGMGRESVTTLWADAATGGTLQQDQLDLSGRLRQRVYRFTDIGAYHYTRRPANSREKALPPAQWTELSEGMRTYSAPVEGQAVTTATVLLWMAAAADLSRAGDRFEVLTFSRRHLNRVTIEAVGRRTVSVDFKERRPASGTRRRHGKVEAIELRLNGSPVGAPADDEEPFELLGLHGDLELLLDPVSRAPLQLRGRVKIAGQLTVHLRQVALR